MRSPYLIVAFVAILCVALGPSLINFSPTNITQPQSSSISSTHVTPPEEIQKTKVQLGHDIEQNAETRVPLPTPNINLKRKFLLPPLEEQLEHVRKNAPLKVRNHYSTDHHIDEYEQRAYKQCKGMVRPHHKDFPGLPKNIRLKGCPAPSGSRPDLFCTPNLGRDWNENVSRVIPLPYAFPAEKLTKLSARELVKMKKNDVARIVPRIHGTYVFQNETAYMDEYAQSFYGITFKKGGWDALRHYEIIFAGGMPYFLDIDYSPEDSLVTLPKKILLEARDLPGVEFDCVNIRVVINHDIFDVERYTELLQQLLDHARKYMTTASLAQFIVQSVTDKPKPTVLFYHMSKRGVPLRAQGSYNSWMLFHGLKMWLGKENVYESHNVAFLYDDYPVAEREKNKRKSAMYGKGFGYAYLLPSGLRNVGKPSNPPDVIIYGDVPPMMPIPSWKKGDPPTLFVHPPDVVHARPEVFGYDINKLYRWGENTAVLQREVMDCHYYTPGPGSKAQLLKRCVWFKNRNCFDEVNIDNGRTYRI